jgi:hypothetical protein
MQQTHPILILIILLLMIGIFMTSIGKRRCGGCQPPIREGLGKNSYGTTTVRDDLRIIQGGGNYPFVY